MKAFSVDRVAVRIVLALFLLLAPFFSLNAGEAAALEQQKVYVVMSTTAEVYHIDRSCRGLRKATHKIKEVTIEKARKMGRRPCKICCKENDI